MWVSIYDLGVSDNEGFTQTILFFFTGKYVIIVFFVAYLQTKQLLGSGWRVEISELMPVVETCLVTFVLCEESEFVSWQFTGKETHIYIYI